MFMTFTRTLFPGLLLLTALLSWAAPDSDQRSPIFVPFADVYDGCGTPNHVYVNMTPIKITNSGIVAGNTKANIECNDMGFVRSTDGTITNISVQPFGTGASTTVTSMNETGSIIGYGSSGSIRFPGGELGTDDPWLRTPDGTVTVLSSEFSVLYPYYPRVGTADINASGVIVGSQLTSGTPEIRGFIRNTSGNVTYFDAPNTLSPAPVNSPMFMDPGTYVIALNDAGVITGYFAGTNATQGFVRAENGTFTMFNAAKGATETLPTAMNQFGEIIGRYTTTGLLTYESIPVFHGFIRNVWGQVTTFDVPGALPGTTLPTGINNISEIVGSYQDSTGTHGFLRTIFGQYMRIDYPTVPPNTSTCNNCYGTYITGINDVGVAIGWYNNTIGTHGFSVNTNRLRDDDDFDR